MLCYRERTLSELISTLKASKVKALNLVLPHDLPMTINVSRDFREFAEKLNSESHHLDPFKKQLLAACDVVKKFERSWSGSQIGYQANVYYNDFEFPPPAHHFSSEWGIVPPAFASGTVGPWFEYRFEDVCNLILRESGIDNFEDMKEVSHEILVNFRKIKSDFASVCTIHFEELRDAYVDDLVEQAKSLAVTSLDDLLLKQRHQRTVSTRDSRASNGGIQSAPHQKVMAEIALIQAPATLCQLLAQICTDLADHLNRIEFSGGSNLERPGNKVFIGHGRSIEWMKLKSYLTETLNLECDEFNRVAIAGVTNIARLSSMLTDAQIAIIVMTAEDEISDGTRRARENVIHEAGLFQGRLGFEKVILVSESTCNIFSNIDGLGRIEFSSGRIEEAFESILRTLIRENVLKSMPTIRESDKS